jgi:hypothetical protein
LGRYYLTTSEDLDHLRKMFTFNVNNIISYELGRTQHGKNPESWNSAAEEPTAPDPINSALVNTIKEHHEDIQKVSFVFVCSFSSSSDPGRTYGACVDCGTITSNFLPFPLSSAVFSTSNRSSALLTENHAGKTSNCRRVRRSYSSSEGSPEVG